jgi:hypothetical protein
MTDIQDLKAIAERCKAHQPLRFMQSYGALYIRNDNGIVFDVHQNRSFPEFMAQNKDYADLVLAADPAAVLELIAEIERLREVMSCVVNEIPSYTHRDGNAPGHCHTIPGVWDRDNGAKAGTECGWCKVWNAAVAMSKEPSHG